jgi:hypothetical protein
MSECTGNKVGMYSTYSFVAGMKENKRGLCIVTPAPLTLRALLKREKVGEWFRIPQLKSKNNYLICHKVCRVNPNVAPAATFKVKLK